MTSRFGLSTKTTQNIFLVFGRHPEIEKAILFGSRAKGTNRPGSDVDLALIGSGITQRIVSRLYQELDELPIPYEFDLVPMAQIQEPEVIAHIQRVGIVFYEREPAPAKS
jgi:predicted nucleotidyltransferase